MLITLLIAILIVSALVCWLTGRQKQAKVLAISAVAMLAFVVAGANIGSDNNHGKPATTETSP